MAIGYTLDTEHGSNDVRGAGKVSHALFTLFNITACAPRGDASPLFELLFKLLLKHILIYIRCLH